MEAAANHSVGSQVNLRRPRSLVLLGFSLLCLVATFVLGDRDVGNLAVSAWLATTAVLGAIVVVRADSFLGWLMLWGTSLGSLGMMAHAGASAGVRDGQIDLVTQTCAWLGQWIQLPALGAFVFLFLLFPTGRLLSRRWRWFAGLTLLGVGLITIGAALSPGPLAAHPAIDNPTGIEGAGAVLNTIQTFGSAMVMIGTASAIGNLFVRLRRARNDEREQVKWVLFAAALLTATGAFAMGTEGALNELSFVFLLVGLFALPVAMTVALTKYRLYNIDLVVNRTLVYLALTGCVIVLYVLIVGFTGSLLQRRVGLVPALVATGVVAVVFQPLRRVAQDLVDRLMFGQRRDPYVALTGLATILQATIGPDEVLPTIVNALAGSLKLAYVAIESEGEGGLRTFAEVGDREAGTAEHIPLVYQGTEIGKLLIVPLKGDTLTPMDRSLVEALAKNAGAAVHAAALTEALRRSRSDIVAAREEERRRLRRDLHDGLGPELAGIALGLGAARNLAGNLAAETLELLERLQEQTDSAARSVRGLVDGLRPIALDDLGLSDALRTKAESMFADSDIDLELDVPTDAPVMPAAVEVAALRIGLEALTNVLRHSCANRCRLTLSVDDVLLLEVTDDGRGINGSHRGVGLGSMTERVQEVGGWLSIEDADGGGTSVRATLPLQ